jgi:2-oxoglutarate ferredoxin oxidoreductase subunit gamma
MRKEVKFAGFGGQGVVKSALLLGIASGLYEQKEIAQTQSYGPEARGGACRSEVVISDEKIDYIKPLHVDSFVVMSQPALDQYVHEIDPRETVVIADTTLIKTIPKNLAKLYPIEATAIAEKEFGNAMYANILLLGALSSLTQLVALEALEKALEGNVPAKTMDKNLAALKKGYAIGLTLRASA